MTLNPFDVQSRHIVTTDGHAETLYAGHGMRGGQQYVLVHRQRTSQSVLPSRQDGCAELYARSTDSDGEEE